MRRQRSAFLAILIGLDLVMILALNEVPQWVHARSPSASLAQSIAPFALSLCLAVAAAFGLSDSSGQQRVPRPSNISRSQPEVLASLTYGCLWGAAVFLVVGITGCVLYPMPTRGDNSSSSESITLLAVNDIYRIEGVDNGARGGLARLRTLRAELETQNPGHVVLLHAGDIIFPSLLSRMFKGQQMIDAMNLLDGDAGAGRFDDRMLVTFGNHEFEKEKCDTPTDSPLQMRLTESEFYWVSTNIQFLPCPGKDPPRLTMFGANLVPSLIIQVGTVRLGVFGLTLQSDHPSYVFADPLATAKTASADLRAKGADIVIALTHLNFAKDLTIYNQLGAQGPDLIIGGHDHDHMALPAGDPHIFKADADAVSAWVIELSKVKGKVSIKANLRQLDSSVRPDPVVATRVDTWLRKHEYRFCREANASSVTCLSEAMAKTKTLLRASETSIRGSEASLGNWVGDLMIDSFASCGAKAALINSGSLRLNQDVAAGATLTRRHIEELLEYKTTLVPIRIPENALWEAMENSVEHINNGGWLQVAGMKMRYDSTAPKGTRVTSLVLNEKSGSSIELKKGGKREFNIVVTEYMLTGSDDGYKNILPDNKVACPAARTNLKDIVLAALAPSSTGGGLVEIAPREEGRICETHQSDRTECKSIPSPSGVRP